MCCVYHFLYIITNFWIKKIERVQCFIAYFDPLMGVSHLPQEKHIHRLVGYKLRGTISHNQLYEHIFLCLFLLLLSFFFVKRKFKQKKHFPHYFIQFLVSQDWRVSWFVKHWDLNLKNIFAKMDVWIYLIRQTFSGNITTGIKFKAQELYGYFKFN